MMTERKTHLDGIAVSLLVVCCLFWGAQQVLIKATLAELPPFYQASLRFIGATALLMLWCKWRNIPLWGRDGSLKPGVIAGLLFAVEFSAIYMGLQFTSASRLTVFLYTSPFWVAALLPLLVPTERLRPLQWVGLACAFAAIVFALRDGIQASGEWLGDALGLAAGLFWGLTTVVIRASSLARVGAEKLLLYQLAVSTLALPAVSLALGETWGFSYSAFAWTSIAVQTVLGAFVSYLVWMWMLTRYPATKMSAFVFLTPIFALLFGALWLRESVTVPLLMSLALVTLGIVLVNRK
jgi:drug/metabolite transporter (DMT)-like permease